MPTAVTRIRPDQAAFFGCLYYAALRPEEAVAHHAADCQLPSCGWGQLTLTHSTPQAPPRKHFPAGNYILEMLRI